MVYPSQTGLAKIFDFFCQDLHPHRCCPGRSCFPFEVCFLTKHVDFLTPINLRASLLTNTIIKVQVHENGEYYNPVEI